MFEKFGRLAEQAATKVSVSRRGFLGRLGQGALATIGVLGGAVAFSQDARPGGSGVFCCKYHCHSPYGKNGGPQSFLMGCYTGGCPPYSGFGNCKLQQQRQVSDCTQC
jgi:hypothetical protein